MKILYSFLILLAFSFILTNQTENLKFLQDYNLNNSLDFKVYSMVWSAKFYNPIEKKKFFFNIPFSFDTRMILEKDNNLLKIDFTNYQNDKANFNMLLKQKENIFSSVFLPLIKFTDDFTKVEFLMNLGNDSEFDITNLKIYQNSIFKSYQIKINKRNDRLKNTLYVTFDFNKKEIEENKMITFEKYFDFLIKK